MRSLRWIPVAYLAGLHGFALFAPYLAIVLTAGHLIRRWQRPAAVPVVAQ
jgi:hypothetical protein